MRQFLFVPFLMPGFAGGGVFWFFLLGYFFKKILGFKIDRNWLYFALVMLFVIVCQILFLNDSQLVLSAQVSNPAIRLNGTIGDYHVSGDVHLYYFIKLLFFSLIFSFISKSEVTFRAINSLGIIILAMLIQCLIWFVISIGGKDIIQILGPSSPNFLVSDSFGSRLSVFYHEPSQMGVVLGALLGGWFVQRFDLKSLFIIILVVAFFIISSRSLSIFVSLAFFIVAFRLDKNILLLLFVLLILFFGSSSVILRGLTEVFPEFSFFFRSAGERLYLPSYEIYQSIIIFVGSDFGQVYYFPPLYNIIFQVGIVGIVGFFILFGYDIRVLIYFLLVSFISPQLWFHIVFLAVSIFSVSKYFSRRI